MLPMAVASTESDWIDLVIARALDLRKAGITGIGFGGCSAQLLPYMEPLGDDKTTGEAVEEYQGDALNDPASWPGGVVPGFTIQKFHTGIEE